MDISEFNELKEKVARFVEITDANLSNKVLNWAKVYSQFLKRFVDETKILADLKTDLDAKFGDLLRKNKETNPYALTKHEMDYYILSDPGYIELKRKVNHQEMIVSYLDNFLVMLKNLQFNLKSYIDLKMFLGGK